MTAEPHTDPGTLGRLKARAATIAARVAEVHAVKVLRGIMAGADAAGGGLLSAGLAFRALFAILPAMLLVAGLSGLVISDPERRSAVVVRVVAAVPPLAGQGLAVERTLDGLARSGGAFSLIGLVGLAWGASAFYGSLDEAMARLFPGGRVRSFVERRLRGAATVLALLVAAFGGLFISGIGAAIEQWVPEFGDLGLWRLVSPLLTIGLEVGVVLLAYRFIPTAPASWRASFLPALFAGLGVALVTMLFSVLAQRLVGALAAFGAIAAVFAALIWLNYVFQLLIWGAAWARFRRDARDAAREAPPMGAGEPPQGAPLPG